MKLNPNFMQNDREKKPFVKGNWIQQYQEGDFCLAEALATDHQKNCCQFLGGISD